MKSLIVLRHSLTRKGRKVESTGSHLSRAGVRLAQDLGATLPAFDYVAVGDQPRHLETALALGCAVDEQVPWPSGYVEGVVAHHDQWTWQEPFAHYADLLREGSALADVAQIHLRHWHRLLGHVGDGGTALVVSSGGSIEPVLVAALPEDDHASWGGAFHQLEGAELAWENGAFSLLRLLRQGAAPS